MMRKFSNPNPIRGIYLGVLMTWLLSCLPAVAQLVVYELEFKRTDGFNDRPFTGGYLVAPVEGGTSSFVFTQGERGDRTIVPAHNAGKLFRAVTEKREVRWVAQAQVGVAASTPPPSNGDDDGIDDGSDDDGAVTPPTQTGVATGSFLATGEAELNATFRTPLVTFETRIAKSLKGRNITAGSDAVDDSKRHIGFVSRGDWRLDFDREQTDIVNREDMDLATATEYLVTLLQGGSDGGGGGGVVDRQLFIQTPPVLPAAVRGADYPAFQLQGSGGAPPFAYTWTLAPGSSLPTGLSLTPGGILSGTVTAATNTYSFTIVLSDSASSPPASRAFTLQVVEQLTITTESPLPNGEVGDTYGPVILSAANGNGTLTWSLASGSPPLPDGMNLLANGTLHGSPTESGSFEISVQVSDSGPPAQSVTKNLQLTIDP